MRTPVNLPIAEIVPHAGPMCLLHRAVEADADSFVAEVDVRADGLFAEAHGWLGLEYMAQTIGAWAGWQARQRGIKPKIGFLLGSRRYECTLPVFPAGQTLQIEIHRNFIADNGLGQFDCRIRLGDKTVATAALTIFEPSDSEAFLKGTQDV